MEHLVATADGSQATGATPDRQPVVWLNVGTFQVKLAESPAELEAAYRLRYRIFNLEMGEGLAESCLTGQDTDRFDPLCDHLLIRDLPSNRLVGTYRILRKTVAVNNGGFYSESEFDLGALPDAPGEFMEVGRSCVDPEFRTGAVVNLLWAGLAQYVNHHGIRFLFGCASLHQLDTDHVKCVCDLLLSRYPAGPRLRVTPRPANRVRALDEDPTVPEYDAGKVFRSLPPLLKGYLRLGAKVCGPPAFDPEFGCVDFLFLLPTEKISERYRRHYFREGNNP